MFLAVATNVQNVPTDSREAPCGSGPSGVRPLRPGESHRLVRWLDDSLRDGRYGRLAAEYGCVLDDREATHHRVVSEGDRFVAHAMARCVRVRAAGVELCLGMIGLVYTEPAFRRRGLAADCIGACESWLADRGAALVVLWSDRHAWYARLGYHLTGVELLFRIDASACAAARRRLPFDGEVGDVAADDWPDLEAAYRARSVRAERRDGYLASLASGPDCRVSVARRGGRAVAYAALGRGNDFPGVVHEWAGEPAGVLACLAQLLDGRESLAWLTGPADLDAEPAVALRAGRAELRRGGFGLVKLLDPEPLWPRLAAGDPALAETRLERRGAGFRLLGTRAACDLDGAAGVGLLLEPGGFEAARAALSDRELRSLSTRLPWPLFVWGFDSV